MKRIELPERSTWGHILQRPVIDTATLEQQVKGVLDVVKQDSDKAVLQFTRQFDGVQLSSLVVTDEEIASAIQQVPDDLKRAIKQAANNIRVFHEKQKAAIEVVETMKGVRCWRKSVGIDKVGLYIPGGTAPLFSTILMLAIPAQIAGCKEVILCSPPDKEGKLNPAILYAASLTGVHKIFKVGGVQAIAAMAYGTETVPSVYKIFGPGNQYVTCAKQLVQQEGTAIDMPAGPSEVCVLADASANPSFVAADLLSQAEHGADSQVLLVSTDNQLIDAVIQELSVQLKQLSRKEMAAKALENSKAIFVKNMDDAIDLVNEYAAEHLIIACEQDEWIAEKITNAGSVFLGNYSPESVGDYASGTNHTLPTNGFARAYSGVSLDSFVKKITYQRLTKEGLTAIAPTVTAMAAAEGLDAHKKAVTIRL
ncbi:MAG: histidinol dehydrogenase [Sediminibacterium sp.]|jgi:histidinol dehydrogenase|uniref:histidinol dehydrogenase n=1 Tax=Sediminibacterium sp. TaxID=1917865 RepID=UPI002ABC642B|nr:histidinol dehydrogenase [Sediminibacterium sp.]MDZ4071800.1 histidinol dehydrogenase [Sediminibacterium sp.]